MLQLVVFASVAAACLVGSFWLIDGSYPLLLVKHGGYWLILAASMIFLQSLFLNRKIVFNNAKAVVEAGKWACLFAAVAVGMYFLFQDTYFKITMDEIVLASTSMHMHLEKEVFTASRGYEVNGVFYILGGYLDKRPYFFAFVVSLVHDLFGYRANNVFYLNAVVSFFLLMGVYLLGTLSGGRRWGWLAMLLLISVPLYGVNVNGGGFELFNLLMILVTVYLGKCWMNHPSNYSLVAFTYSGLLLAQCRYESILFVLPVGLLILWVWWREKKVMLPWPLYLAPLILMPFVLQNRVLNESKVLWQLEEHQAAPFGMEYLSLNLSSAADFFLNIGNDQANSLLLVPVTVISILLWLVYHFYCKAGYPIVKTAWRPVGWAFGLTILANFLLLMFYYWGQLNDPAASRLSLPLHLALILFAVYAFSRNPWGKYVPRFGIFLTGACIWFLALPNITESKYLRGGYEARQIEWMDRKLKDHTGPILVITGYHMMELIHGISAVPIHHVISRMPELEFHLRNHTFAEILLVHRDSTSGASGPGKHTPFREEELKKHFDLEPLYSYQLGPGEIARISRVNALHLSEEEQSVFQGHLAEFKTAASDPQEDLSVYFSKWLP